jgi:hypothetical protein
VSAGCAALLPYIEAATRIATQPVQSIFIRMIPLGGPEWRPPQSARRRRR